MAENKKSFVLYCDLLHTVGHLTDEQAGKLFKHILSYVNDKDPQTEDVIINLAFEPIKQQLKRDLKKWVGYIKKQRDNGKKGGRPPVIEETQKTQAFSDKPKKADSVTVDVNVSVDDTVNVNDILREIEIGATIEFCSLTIDRNYDNKKVVELWQAFLINGQKKNYTGREKKVQHFRNWIKTQPHETDRRINGTGIKAKLGTSEARIKRAKEW